MTHCHFEDGYIDHFEVYEEILSPEFIRKHYSFVEAVSGTGAVKSVRTRDPIRAEYQNEQLVFVGRYSMVSCGFLSHRRTPKSSMTMT